MGFGDGVCGGGGCCLGALRGKSASDGEVWLRREVRRYRAVDWEECERCRAPSNNNLLHECMSYLKSDLLLFRISISKHNNHASGDVRNLSRDNAISFPHPRHRRI